MTSTHRTKDRRGRLKENTERGKGIPARTKEPAHRRKEISERRKSSRRYGEMDCAGRAGTRAPGVGHRPEAPAEDLLVIQILQLHLDPVVEQQRQPQALGL